MISFENITKKFGSSIIALDDVSLEIADGEFVFLVGPSGAGKSTLLRLLSREYLPNSGKIIVDEIDLSNINKKGITDYRRKVGFVFQDFKLLDDRTVWENVALALQVRGLSEPEII